MITSFRLHNSARPGYEAASAKTKLWAKLLNISHNDKIVKQRVTKASLDALVANLLQDLPHGEFPVSAFDAPIVEVLHEGAFELTEEFLPSCLREAIFDQCPRQQNFKFRGPQPDDVL